MLSVLLSNINSEYPLEFVFLILSPAPPPAPKLPSNRPSPTTCSFSDGEVVPIPTFPVDSSKYKIVALEQKYDNVAIGCFAPPLFMSGESFDGFRNIFSKSFDFCDGMLFQASNFADVKGLWGISFTVWQTRKNGEKE